MKTEKDPMIKVRSFTNKGKNSKGGDWYLLYVGGDPNEGNKALDEMIETLQACKDNPRGASINLHVSKKEHMGKEFDSAIMFIKPTQESPFNRGSTTKPTPAPKADVAAFKNQQLKG